MGRVVRRFWRRKRDERLVRVESSSGKEDILLFSRERRVRFTSWEISDPMPVKLLPFR